MSSPRKGEGWQKVTVEEAEMLTLGMVNDDGPPERGAA
jgi:hypothetical protein